MKIPYNERKRPKFWSNFELFFFLNDCIIP